MAVLTSLKVPIYARIGRKEVHIGVVEIPVKAIGGSVKTPTERDVKAAIRKGLR